MAVLAALLCGGAAARSLVGEARAIAGRAEDIARLWPGFWPAEQAFVLYRRDGECVIYSPLLTPAGFEAVEEAQGRLWRGHCTGRAFEAPILLAGEVGGVEAVGVLVDGRTKGVPEFLLHEAFRAFQRTHFQRRDSAGPDLNAFDFPADEDWMRWKLREALLLMEAVAKEEPPARHALIHLALALRESRLQAMPAAAGGLEDHYMRWEGTASYVERRLRGEVASADTARVLAAEAMRGATSFAPWEFLLRVQSYHTGAAVGLLLDALGFADWRQRVMSGEPLYGLLAEATGYLGRNASALRELAESLRMDGLDSLVKRMQRNAELIGVAETRYSRAARHRLWVDLSQAVESSFQAAGMVGTSGGTLVLEPDPFIAVGEALELKVSKRPVWIRSARPPDVLESSVEVALPKPPEVSGCPLGSVERCPEGTRITARGLQLLLKRPAVIESGPELTRILPASESGGEPGRVAEP